MLFWVGGVANRRGWAYIWIYQGSIELYIGGGGPLDVKIGSTNLCTANCMCFIGLYQVMQYMARQPVPSLMRF